MIAIDFRQTVPEGHRPLSVQCSPEYPALLRQGGEIHTSKFGFEITAPAKRITPIWTEQYDDSEKGTIILYGGTLRQVKEQKVCDHQWYGPCIDEVGRYYKCVDCFCLQREAVNGQVTCEVCNSTHDLARSGGCNFFDGWSTILGGY